MKRYLQLGVVGFLFLICTGCGDVFRPTIIPPNPIFPNPAAAHTIVTISDNGDVSAGSAMVIDVSGDSEVSIKNMGVHPVHLVQQTANQILVVNQTDATVPQDSVSRLTFSGTVIFAANTITLPTSYDPGGSQAVTTALPNFVATTEASEAYVLMPRYQPVQTGGPIIPSIAVINTTSDSITATIPVGNNPMAMAETPDARKLYVANFDDNTISGFNTLDRSARTVSGSFASPTWLAIRSDNQRLYVLGDGTLSTVDISTTAGPDNLIGTIAVPAAADRMWYDVVLNRLYIPGGQQLLILDASQSLPTALATISIPPLNVLPAGSTVPATAVAITSLPDGSRAYVGSYAVLPSAFTVSSVTGNGVTATYVYTLTGGHDLTAGVAVTVTGTGGGFDGTFLVSEVISGTAGCPGTCFQAPNASAATGGAGSGTANNIFSQVTVVDTSSNTVKTTTQVPGSPDATDPTTPYYAPICSTTRFRFTMAAAGDSTRAYMSSCDAGNVNIIYTKTDTYALSPPAPLSGRPPIPPSTQNPPQNPVFMIAGP